MARLKAYANLLTDWNARHNLVAKSTLPDLWHRHLWDSAQLAPLIPETPGPWPIWVPAPAFPAWCWRMMRPELKVTLHEATTKKCAFLQAAAERMGMRSTIRNARMEDCRPRSLMW